jgi:uncharacterized protein (DUF924 family)
MAHDRPATPAERLLLFWFGALSDGFADSTHRARWFSGGVEFDNSCRVEFSSLATQAANGDLEHWLDEPRSRLAYVLLCDQIPRNIYRGEALAFATDGAALIAARTGIEAGMDRALAYDERNFCYLPFEHSESLVDQHTSVGLFMNLCDDTPEGFRDRTGSSLRYARQHRNIVQRFGRFPHRNKVLGRKSSAAELAFLQDGPAFGQSDSSTVSPD